MEFVRRDVALADFFLPHFKLLLLSEDVLLAMGGCLFDVGTEPSDIVEKGNNRVAVRLFLML